MTAPDLTTAAPPAPADQHDPSQTGIPGVLVAPEPIRLFSRRWFAVVWANLCVIPRLPIIGWRILTGESRVSRDVGAVASTVMALRREIWATLGTFDRNLRQSHEIHVQQHNGVAHQLQAVDGVVASLETRLRHYEQAIPLLTRQRDALRANLGRRARAIEVAIRLALQPDDQRSLAEVLAMRVYDAQMAVAQLPAGASMDEIEAATKALSLAQTQLRAVNDAQVLGAYTLPKGPLVRSDSPPAEETTEPTPDSTADTTADSTADAPLALIREADGADHDHHEPGEATG